MRAEIIRLNHRSARLSGQRANLQLNEVNQYVRPRIVQNWYLGWSIPQIARREKLKPSVVEKVLNEETIARGTVPPTPPARHIGACPHPFAGGKAA